MEEEKSYQEIRKELIDKYITKIVPKVQEYRDEWEKFCNKYGGRRRRGTLGRHIKKEIEQMKSPCFIFLLFIVSDLCIFFYTMCSAYKDSAPVTGSFIASSVIFWLLIPSICFFMMTQTFYVIYKETKSLYNRLKNTVMPIVCDCFSNLEYVSDGIHYTEEYKKAYVIPTHFSITYDDCLIGKHKGVQFIIEELKTIGIMSSFTGVVIQCRINKKFKKHTVIYPDSDLHISPSSNLHHTELEDIVFEKKYDVYTNDDVEARYLITPGFMKRLNDIKSKFYADKIYVAFYDEVLYLALNTNKDLFEISSEKGICDKVKYINMVEEIISIYKLIDYFKLDQKIGM